MLSERRTRELHESLVKRIDDIYSKYSKKGYDEWEIRKINAEELAKLEAQIEILRVVIDHDNQ